MITNPLALIGLAAVPALLAVYLLRNRVKHHRVSSLMLWVERSRMTTGGGWFQRNRLPLLFFLELLIILLLIWAATNPLRLSREAARPLIVVLDNSASMSAVGNDGMNVAERAQKKLPRLIKQNRFSPVRYLLAGSEPRWLNEDFSKDWKLTEPAFNVDKALLLARENSTPSTKILVISDARPATRPTSGNLRWMAFGQPLKNNGFVNGVRSGERCMVEIAGSGNTELELKLGDQTKTVSVELPARKIFRLADPKAPFEASLPNDALELDNRVHLLAKPEKKVQIQQSIRTPEFAELIARSIAATGMGVGGEPELIITDGNPTLTNLETWVLHIVAAKEASPFTGPFVVDHDSKLMEGVSFEGLIWAASEQSAMPGMPIVMAGNVPLLTRQDDLAGRAHFYLQIDPALSTMQHSPVWPTLIWNLLQARAALQPGFKEVNLRPGIPMVFVGDAEVVEPETPGIVELESEGETFRAVYNFMDAEESDLSSQGLGDDGDWMESETVEREYTALAPVIIVAALGLLSLHQFLLLKESGVAA